MAIPSFRASSREPSGCLLSPIRRPDAYYSRRNLLYESRRQSPILEGPFAAYRRTEAILPPNPAGYPEAIMQPYHL
jgi:hypothetical protein